ncbi:MAG: DUF6976 family protein [Chromatiales bacterium]
MALSQPKVVNLSRPKGESKLMSVGETRALIEAGRLLWLAGDEALLAQLPKGRWVGGSIPYFMGEAGGATTRNRLYVSELPPSIATRVQVKFYGLDTLHNIATDAPDNGFTLVMIPALSAVHMSYAENAPEYQDMFLKPIAGWVTGIHLDDLGKVKPVVFSGVHAERCSDKALAMHVTLKADMSAKIGIVNTFSQGTGDTFEFPETGFSATNCLVNGMERNFAEYLLRNRVDTRLPLVADYSGAMINVSFQQVDEATRKVSFYAPVFKHAKYRLAAPVQDYVGAFMSAVPALAGETVFACNCVLNYLYAELEGKCTANITGPMTFGEIAYQLLNQTMVYLMIEQVG